MRLCSMYNIERIIIHPNDEPHTSHYIDLTVGGTDPTFAVTCYCDDEWIWEFIYSQTNYEMIKHIIMDIMVECDSMEELIEELDEVFETEFMDIVCGDFDDEDDADEDAPCDGDCEHCDMIFN